MIETWLDVVQARARATPDREALTFLCDGERDAHTATYGDLDRRARAIAAGLVRSGIARGERVLLIYPPGLDYVTGFLGALYAGVVAVPVYPPDPARLHRTLPRLQAICRDAQAVGALTTATLRELVPLLAHGAPELAALRWLATDSIEDAAAAEWTAPQLSPETVAFLQYTSGSTGAPKGVVLSHANLISNSAAIQRAFDVSERSVSVIWLPPYHDMGLIGGILQPLFSGCHGVLMSPLAFLARPLRWLEAISRYRASISGAPNFAFDLVVRKSRPAERAALELASWQVAFTGAEPIRAATLERFAAAFECAGFDRSAILPCYGLAEATLLVAGRRTRSRPVVRQHERAALIGCRADLAEPAVRIVDPITRQERAPGQIGEIWIAGASVASGYLGLPEQTAETFGAHTAAGDGPFLRSGDLGFVDGSDLFVCGRRKDLIIVRGRNFYPQDIEQVVETRCPEFRAGCTAAFGSEIDGEERLVVVQELASRDVPAERLAQIASLVRTAVVEALDVQVYAVSLVAPGAVPKTTSGKVQRRQCREDWQTGALPEVHGSTITPAIAAVDEALPLETWLRARVAAYLRVAPDAVSLDEPLVRQGLDSLAAVELQNELEPRIGAVPLEIVLSGSLRAIAARSPLVEIPIERGDPDAGPLSPGQQALWFLHQLDPSSTAYHLVRAATVEGPVDPAALERSLQLLVDRHGALRTVFPAERGAPAQRVLARANVDFAVVEIAGELDPALRACADDPFDLARGPLFRVRLFRGTGPCVLVVVLHHLVADLWSVALLLRELRASYRAARRGTALELAPIEYDYTDYVRWQQALLASPRGGQLRDYWVQQLAGELPRLDLLPDRAPPAASQHRASAVGASIDRALVAALERLAAEHDATLFQVALAAFALLLHRVTGQRDVIIGAPTAGRLRAAWAPVLGYFVNPLPIRSRLDGDPTFVELLSDTRRTVLDALAHQELPFEQIAELLRTARTDARAPVFQVLFSLQRAPELGDAALGQFALGVPRARLSLDDLTLEARPLPPAFAQCDLALDLVVDPDRGIAAMLDYDCDRFERATAERLLQQYATLLAAIAAAPTERALRLRLLDDTARRALIERPAAPAVPAACIHELVARRAQAAPEQLAVSSGARTLTYRALDARANELAHRLRALGVARGSLVGLDTARTLELYVGLLGILKAGAAFVPIDAAAPPARRAALLAESGARLVVDATIVSDAEAHRPPEVASELDDLAYVMFTSGSTGRPKGVMISHRAVLHHAAATIAAFELTPADRALQFASLAFDASIEEIIPAWLAGAAVVQRDDEMIRSAGEFARAVDALGITVLNLPTAYFQHWITELDRTGGALPRAVRLTVIGGERADRGPIERWQRRGGGRLLNTYGPTEATITATRFPIDELSPAHARVPIGRPYPHVEAYVLDAHGEPVPVGVPGTLYLGGPALARGYLARPELTAAAFVAHPFAPGERLYCTGDRARMLGDRNLEFLGRLDDQIKLRGHRIELGEIEAALRAIPGVDEACVILRDRLVAYFVSEQLDASAVRRELAQRLPAVMIPAACVPLPALPRTTSGKLDRTALPDPVAPDTADREPRDSIERALAQIWSEVLGIDRASPCADFFELGGHSLLATQVVARIEEQLGVALPLRALFECPTIEALARRIAAGDRAPAAPISRRADPAQDAPLSSAQTRLWILDRLAGGDAAYGVLAEVRLRGALEIPVLRDALTAIAARHEALRTRFVIVDGLPVQRIADPAPIELAVIEAAEGSLDAEARRGFDLVHGPLFRTVLFRCAPDEHVLFVGMHHIIADGWSVGVLVRELSELYRAGIAGAAPRLPALPIQYADFAAWEHARWDAGALADQLAHWAARLAGMAPLALPADFPRPEHSTRAGERIRRMLPRALSEQLHRLARAEGTTLFAALCAGVGILLQRGAGDAEIAMGMVVAGRERRELAGLIGCFVNTLVFRARAAGTLTVREWLRRSGDVVLDALAHQELPFDRLVEALRPQRELDRTPLVPIVVALHNLPAPQLELGTVTVESRAIDTGVAKFDLSLAFEELPDGLAVELEYRTELYRPATAAGWLDQLAVIFDEMVADPERPLRDLERRRGPATLVEAFEACAAQHRAVPAVVCGEARWTYAELARRVRELGRLLIARGVGPGDFVALCVPRSLELPLAVLGILGSGAAYVPLDPDHPDERLRSILEDCRPRVLVTVSALAPRVRAAGVPCICLDEPPEHSGPDPDRPSSGADAAAYVLYTSGSTGRPKGAVCEHAGPLNLIRDLQRRSPIRPGDRVGYLPSIGFDASIIDLFGALLCGGTLDIAPQAVRVDGEALAAWIVRRQIRAAWIPPFLLPDLASALERAAVAVPLQRVVTGAEPIPEAVLARLVRVAPHLALWNAYGPTEASVYATLYRASSIATHDFAPIGAPIDEVAVYVLDPGLELLPIGAAGEIFIGGIGVARGYHDRPALTAERFVRDPFTRAPGGRMYRTGDRGRWLPGGVLEFLGRGDRQIKLAGVRLELGEIESALRERADIAAATAIVREDRPGERRLVAYVVPAPGAAPDDGELRRALAARLPAAMIPSAFVMLDALPITINGKLDRASLPAPRRASHGSVPPRTSIEERVARLWSEVLRLDAVGAEDDFFALGGSSLQATQVVARIHADLGIELSLRDFFASPTVAAMAAQIAARGLGSPSAAIALRAPGAVAPASFSQARLWFLDRLLPGSAQYNVAAAFHVRGPLDRSRFAAAVERVIERHEVLRTAFAAGDGGPVQIAASAIAWEAPALDLASLPEAARRERLEAALAGDARWPFDLERGPLLRVRLVRLAADDHAISLAAHHIVCDGWSAGLMLREIAECYAALVEQRAPRLPELPVQYADYAIWQRARLTEPRLAPLLRDAVQRLAGAPPVLALPADRPRPPVATGEGAEIAVALDGSVWRAVQELGERARATPFMIALAAWKLVLARHARQTDIVVGTPAANRGPREIEHAIGFFVNTLAVRTDLSGDPSFGELVERVREASLGALAQQEVPFERLVEELGAQRDPSISPVVQVMFALQSEPAAPLALRGLAVEPMPVALASAKFDLTLLLEPRGDGLGGALEFRSDLFDRETAQELASSFEAILRAAVAEPARRSSELTALDPAARATLTAWGTGPRLAAEAPDLRARICAAPGDRVALQQGEVRVTYAELRARVDELAAALRDRGVGPDRVVGLCFDRSPGAIIAMLGVLAAGGAYLPLDLEAPVQRLLHMQRETGAAWIVSDRGAGQRVAAELAGDPEPVGDCLLWSAGVAASLDRAVDDPLAYVLYTSGSTGAPKGVAVTARNLAASTAARWQHYREDVGTYLLLSPLIFDSAVAGLYWTLTQGGTLLLPPAGPFDPAAIGELIAARAVTHLLALPSLYRILLDAVPPERLRSLRVAIVAGEPCPDELVEAHDARLGAELHNEYGPTEATVWCTAERCAPGAPVSIGRPIPGAEISIVDDALRPVPIGVPGQLVVGGALVARGYIGDPALTAARFVERAGARMFLTGDLARWRRDGRIELMGRLDAQIKIRGVRVDPTEIEAALLRHPAITEAAVIAVEQRLVAWCVASNDLPPLATFLRDHLPARAIPSVIQRVAALPRGPTGKLDRRALAALPLAPVARAAPLAGDIERVIAQAWCDLLGLPEVGAESNFFDLGGHSLLLLKLQAALAERLNRTVPVVDLLAYPTVRSLAVHLAGGSARDAVAPDAGKARLLERSRRRRGPAR